MEYDAKFTCRACLARIEDGTSIFEFDSKQSTKLAQMLADCINTDVNIFEMKYYPDKLCAECVDFLPKAWKFIEICKTSQQILQKCFSNMNNEKIFYCNVEEQDIKNEIKIENEDHSDDAEEFKTEIFVEDISVEAVDIKPKIKKQRNRIVGSKRKVDKMKNADVKSYCPDCEDIFDTELKLRKHMKLMHPDSTAKIVYSCNVCPKQFNRKPDYVVHRRIHSGEKPFQCQICFRGFTQSGTLIEHSRLHTGETPFVCQICKKHFSSRSSFARHRLVHSKEKLFACELCGKMFGHNETLKQHKLVHSDDRPYVCDICNKATKSKWALQAHLLIHAKKNFVCEHCGRKFSVKHNLEVHIKKMHSENAGECQICSKVTSNLAEHMITHSGIKPYKCKICNRDFKHKNSFSFHLTMHKNAEKYKCEIEGCSKAFPKANMLRFHINKIHANETPHTCPKCSKGFYRNCDLSRHLNTAHPDAV